MRLLAITPIKDPGGRTAPNTKKDWLSCVFQMHERFHGDEETLSQDPLSRQGMLS